MSNFNTIRAWRDPNYFRSLSETDKQALGVSPAGAMNEEAGPSEAFGTLLSCQGTAICTPCPPQHCY